MIEVDYTTSKHIRRSSTPHAVDTFHVRDKPQGVVLKLKYPNVKPGFRVLYRVKKQGEMTLEDHFYTVDLEQGRVTLNWDFDLDCTFVVEYTYDPGT